MTRRRTALVVALCSISLALVRCGGDGDSHTSPKDPASLSGRLTDSSSAATIEGAVVSAGGKSTTTGADGRYILNDLVAGSVTVIASRDGYQGSSKSITLNAGANQLDITLTRASGGTATLAGIVTTSGTTNPITGVVVSTQGRSSTTGTDGKYSLTGLATGSTTVTAERSGYQTFAQTITLTQGSNTRNIALSQSTGGTSVDGTVRGLYPIDGRTYELSGATVTIAGKTDTTDSTGHYQLPSIPEGTQAVTVKLAGWADYSQSFFISSTSKTINVSMSYNGPQLTNLTAEWLTCWTCRRGIKAFKAGLHATFGSSDSFTITALFDGYATIDGHEATLDDPLRRGDIYCRLYCDQTVGFPEDAPRARDVHTAGPGTYTTQFRKYLDAFWVASKKSSACDFAELPSDGSVTFGVRGTLTFKNQKDVNQWTHASFPFDFATPLVDGETSDFCRY